MSDEVVESTETTATTKPVAAAPAPVTPAATTTPNPKATVAPDEDKPGYWAPDWREKMSGGDEKTLKQLQRYGSPEDVWKKARALEVERSSGKLKPVLSKEATPEELAEYRKSWGIPDAADKYDLSGVKVDDVDRPMLGEVMKAMHAVHAPPETVKAVAAGWAAVKQQAFDHQAESDRTAKTNAEDTLRQEWGTDYRRNMNLVHQLLDTSGDPKIKEQLLGGRLEDGTPVGSSPAALRMLLGVALAQNPTGMVVPTGGGDPAASLKSELKRISDLRVKDRKAYDKDNALQAKEREYIGAAQKAGLMDEQGNWKK